MNWQDKSLLEKIQDRWTEMDSKYSRVNRNRDVIVTYFRCDEILEVDAAGQLVGQEIYNASGMWYSQMMARGFQGSLVSKNIPWIQYLIDRYELQGIDPLDEWCQEIKQYMLDDYQRSNFYDVQPQFTLDGITIGSPVLFGDEDILNRRVIWTPTHYKNVRVYYDKANEPDGVIHRDPNWTAKQLFDTFIVKDDASGSRQKSILPGIVTQALDSGRLNDEFVVYRAVFRSNNSIWNGMKKKPTGWPWLSVYFCDLAEKEQKEKPLNMDMGFFSQPFVVWDYDKKPWECVSRAPAWYAVWDNLGLQDESKALAENRQLKNRPPRIALSQMAGRFDFSSEGITLADDAAEYGMPPKALDMIGDIRLDAEMIRLSEDKIRRWFLADLWNRFGQLARENGAPVSTLQIWQMVSENATQLSPAIESHSKYLKTADARHLDVAKRRGECPFDPFTLAEMGKHVYANLKSPQNTRVDIMPQFVGGLAQAQKRNQELEPVRTGASMLIASGLTQLSPETKYVIKGYKTADKMLQAVGFPADCVNTEEDVQAMFQAEQQAMAQQQQFENSVEMAKASKPASDAATTMMGAQQP